MRTPHGYLATQLIATPAGIARITLYVDTHTPTESEYTIGVYQRATETDPAVWRPLARIDASDAGPVPADPAHPMTLPVLQRIAERLHTIATATLATH
ncbi:hypothetical protein [Nocardia cyriacigeorgica]|uniref:hypothetical protein n=1 Tax=Nocardia cyriacigeorgica TaxID=135487 RepID=UPI0018961ADD|nr:hypothetical protein [Nocardia cyriacigeorgica]MBF6416956.1 hypothetical protein [Nocardia cyriacigeorgica]